MIKEAKRQLYLGWKDYLLQILVTLGAALLLTAIAAIVVAATGDVDFMPRVGAAALCGVAGFYSLFACVANIGVRFNSVIKMGAVRRNYLLVNLVISFGITFALIMFANAWALIENLVFAPMGMEVVWGWFIKPLPAAGIALAVNVFGIWAGSMMMRFGKAGFWVMWAIWMVVFVGGSQVSSALSEERTDVFSQGVRGVVAFFEKWPLPGIVWLGAVVVLAFGLCAWLVLRKAPAYD